MHMGFVIVTPLSEDVLGHRQGVNYKARCIFLQSISAIDSLLYVFDNYTTLL